LAKNTPFLALFKKGKKIEFFDQKPEKTNFKLFLDLFKAPKVT